VVLELVSSAVQIVYGPCWGDELCDVCGNPAEYIVHLAWANDADEDYRQSCAEHREDLAIEMVTAYRERRGFYGPAGAP
jgi:hypothetical protein